MMTAAAVLLLLSLWRYAFEDWMAPFGVMVFAAVAIVAVYSWRMGKRVGMVLGGLHLGLAAVLSYAFCFFSAISHAPATLFELVLEGVFLALAPVLLVLIIWASVANPDQRIGAIIGAAIGLILARVALLVIPGVGSFDNPAVSASLVSVFVFSMVGLDIGRYAERHPGFWRNRGVWVVFAIVAVAGTVFRVCDVASGNYCGYTVAEIAAMGKTDVLLRKIETSLDPSVRRTGIQAVGMNGGPEMASVLIRRLSDRDKYVRIAAAECLRYHPSRNTVPALIVALRDNDVRVQQASAESLGGLGDKQAVPHLLQMLRSGDTRQWEAAAASAVALGAQDEVVRALKGHQSSTDAWVHMKTEQLLNIYSRRPTSYPFSTTSGR